MEVDTILVVGQYVCNAPNDKEQLEEHADPPAPEPDAPMPEIMAHRLETKVGKALYGLRKEPVEPVFGIIKGGHWLPALPAARC